MHDNAPNVHVPHDKMTWKCKNFSVQREREKRNTRTYNELNRMVNGRERIGPVIRYNNNHNNDKKNGCLVQCGVILHFINGTEMESNCVEIVVRRRQTTDSTSTSAHLFGVQCICMIIYMYTNAQIFPAKWTENSSTYYTALMSERES